MTAWQGWDQGGLAAAGAALWLSIGAAYAQPASHAAAPAASPGPAASASPAPPRPPTDALRVLWCWLDAQVAYEKLPGLTAAIVVGQEVVGKLAIGSADHAGRQPMRPDTLFSICSISKVFTAIAVMQLWEDGKLSLDDDVAKWVPALALQRHDPDSGPVTLRALLTHSAGVPRDAAFPYWADQRFPSTEALLRATASQRTLMRVAERHQYSNLGMALLGEVVAAASGMPYAQYVQQRILDPLALRDTRPSMPAELWGTRLAQGFGPVQRDGKRTPMPVFDTQGLVPAAGFSSTVEDLARVLVWQNRLRKNGGREVLKVAMLREMQRAQWADADTNNTWGYGFCVHRDAGKWVTGHDGACAGYLSDMTLALDDEAGIALMINANDNRWATRLSSPARRLLLKGLRLPPAPAAGPVLAEYSGRYGGAPFASESVILPWGADLAYMDLPVAEPATAMALLRHLAGDTFRRVRADNSLGSEFTFVRDAAGRVTSVSTGGYIAPRTAPMEGPR